MIKILVVDDDPFMRTLLVDRLIEAGYDVIEASDGAAALEKACDELPDLIFLDVLMPVMNGLEVVRRLRKIPALEATQVIMVSVFAKLGAKFPGPALGYNDYITKPWRPSAIEAAIKKALGATETAAIV